MERIDIICVGTLKEKFMRELCEEYKKRLSRYCKLTLHELSEYRLPSEPSEAEITRALEAEAEQMLNITPVGAYKIAMCIEGKMLDSVALSKQLQGAMDRQGKVTIYIGSSYGLAGSLKSQCDLRLSMSPMTFPHQLARGMLFEQLYRSYKIRKNETYHK